MSYSRWSNSDWYTYWMCQPRETENRDSSIFEICGIKSFTAKEIRDDIKSCLLQVENLEHSNDLIELEGYMLEFLQDVDEEYPL